MDIAAGTRTSDHLVVDHVYTREDLRQQFSITDATLNTGVFRPKDTASVWLFITEEKTSDRTQYHDRLDGDLLHWQGQTSGRTDSLIIDHRHRGLEILVFLRKRKYEFPGAGFRYIGLFNYVSHSGGGPTDFILRRAISDAALIAPEQADADDFDPDDIEDARERVARTIAQRRGQQAFRDALLAAYEERCAISGCTVVDVLEAAHIVPYQGSATNVVSNGLLLRADLHVLFDCGLIAIDPDKMVVVISSSLRNTGYQQLNGKAVRLPKAPAHRPNRKALGQQRSLLRP
jgi:hypothetical protein